MTRYRDMTDEQRTAWHAKQAKRSEFTDRLHEDIADAARVAGISVAQLAEAERIGKGPMSRWTTDLKRFGVSYRPMVPGRGLGR